MECRGKIRIYDEEDMNLPGYYNRNFYLAIFTLTSLLILCFYPFKVITEYTAIIVEIVSAVILFLLYSYFNNKADKILSSFTKECSFKIDEHNLNCLIQCDDGSRFMTFLHQVLLTGDTDSKYDSTIGVIRISNKQFPILTKDGIKSRVCCLLIHDVKLLDLFKEKGIFILGMDI